MKAAYIKTSLSLLLVLVLLSGCSNRESNSISGDNINDNAEDYREQLEPVNNFGGSPNYYSEAIAALEGNDISAAVMLLKQSDDDYGILSEIMKYEDGMELFLNGNFELAYSCFLESPDIPLSNEMIEVYKVREKKLESMSLAEQDCIRVLEQAISVSAYEGFVLNQVCAYNYYPESNSTSQRALIFDFTTTLRGKENNSFFEKCAILPNYYSSIDKSLQRYNIETYEIESQTTHDLMPSTTVEWLGAIQEGLIEHIDFEKEGGLTESGIEYSKIDLSKINACFDFIDLLIAENVNPWKRVFIEENKSSPSPAFPKEPAIGMTSDEVEESTWGEPRTKNINEYSWGTKEQWVYSGNRYIYFENGVVTAISYTE